MEIHCDHYCVYCKPLLGSINGVVFLSDELSGIFVRSIADLSATAIDGRVQVNDQIVEVQCVHRYSYQNSFTSVFFISRE